MKPSIGRIVHYHSSRGPQAALILDVDDRGVYLRVFECGYDMEDFYAAEVPYRDTAGANDNFWDWPPRVED